MSLKSERLLETLLDLERSRQRERDLRLESEALLEGLRCIAEARDTGTLLRVLIKALRTVIDFEEAFILETRDDGTMAPIASSSDKFQTSIWQCQSVFCRAMKGRPVAAFDVGQVPEWAAQPGSLRQGVQSALHIGLQGGDRKAILVVTHSSPRHFGPSDVSRASRFSPLASQALLTLDLQRVVTERDRFFQLSMDLMGIVSFDGTFKQLNDAWPQVLGFSTKELKKRSLYDFVHRSDRKTLREAVRQLERSGEKCLVEVRFRCCKGKARWLSCSLAAYPDEDLCYIVARDVTARVTAERRLAHEARHDPLTGLPNRMAFMARLEKTMAFAKRQPRYRYALLYLDLDEFKAVNDTLGHHAGDELLKEVARRLKSEMRTVDTVARLGGDEFVILLIDVEDSSRAVQVAQRVLELLARPISIEGSEYRASMSIGIAMSTLEYQTGEEILRDADEAMYTAKSLGKSRYVLFNPEADTRFNE